VRLLNFGEEDAPLLADYGTESILASLVKGSTRVDALDARFRKIGAAVLAASRAGTLKKWKSENLVDSFVRLYREWKEAQKNLPFSDQDFNIWDGRAVGWTQVLNSRGVKVSGALDFRDDNPTRPPIAGRVLVAALASILALNAFKGR